MGEAGVSAARGLVAALSLTLAACASGPRSELRLAAADQCGAQAMQGLVGRPIAALPAQNAAARRHIWRIYCTSCMVTQDYIPTRLDIVFDSASGRVTRVKCG
jgi:hypothetical protein